MGKALSICIFALCLCSCSNKVNIDAPYKDITVVYGLLDQSDTAHYIHINKAFLGVGNALTMAQQYDSINYPLGTLTVALMDFDANNDSTIIPLTPTMSIPISPGIFSYPNQVEYYTRQTLNVNDQYKLTITNKRTGKVVTGYTSLIPDIGLDFSISTISWDSNQRSIVSWSSIPNTDIYQMTLRFFYTETAGSGSTLKYLDWVFFPQTTQDNNGGVFLIYQYSGQGLLHLLHSLIPPA
ncbi:MAG TPA: hypothetical protein VNZ45_07530, partial [Bacteroidia bacterium]|nr:hypothetical protein [Bacteroidia bacterium]